VLVLVIWSLAVYAGTAAICLRAAHRWIARVRLRDALWIAALPLLFTGRATLTGGVYAPLDILYHHEPFASQRAQAGIERVQTPILSDVVSSMIPWQAAVRDAVRHGNAPTWNRFVLAGEPLLAIQQAAILHPGTWLGLLLPLPQAWTFQMSLRLFLALLSAFLFLRDLGCRELPALVGAIGWSFSDFNVFWVGYPVGNALGPFPLLVLGLSRILRDGDRRAVALTTLALFLIVTAGHPEALLFAVTGGGLYFLFLLGFAERGRRLRAVLLSVAAGGFALGLTAVQLAPLVEALPHTWELTFRSEWYAHVQKSVDLTESARRAVPTLLPFAYGESGHGALRPNFGIPGGYAGALVLPLAMAGLLAKNRLRLAFLVLGLVGLAISARLALVTDALTSLPLFNLGVTDYMVYLVAFAICALAALGANRLYEAEGVPAFIFGAALSLAAIAVLYHRLEPGMRLLAMPDGFLRARAAGALVPLVLGILCLVWLRGRRSRAGVAALLMLLVASRVVEAGRVYPTCPPRAFAPRLPLLDAVPRNAPNRIVGVGAVLIPNASALYGLEDARGYESMTLRTFHDTFPLWCTPLPAWYNRVDDLRKPFLSFLNVRYALVQAGEPVPPGWELRSHADATDLLENSRALARVFVPARIRYEADAARRLEILASIQDFGDQGVVAETAGHPPGDWRPNGAALVEIRKYEPQAMAIRVDAKEESVIATSVTAWPGWRARLDGRALEPLSYNHAFLAFRVPTGRHWLELRYLSDGLLLGASLSLLTCAVAAIAWHMSRPRRAEATRVLSSPAPRP
jgi:hypothetical protein